MTGENASGAATGDVVGDDEAPDGESADGTEWAVERWWR
jgi:hypothetical protein